MALPRYVPVACFVEFKEKHLKNNLPFTKTIISLVDIGIFSLEILLTAILSAFSFFKWTYFLIGQYCLARKVDHNGHKRMLILHSYIKTNAKYTAASNERFAFIFQHVIDT